LPTVLMLLGYGWWLLAPRKAAVLDAEIELTQTAAEFLPGKDAEALAHMPLFVDWRLDR
jgi:hypothetical protein